MGELKGGLRAAREHRRTSDRRREAREMRAILNAYSLEGDPLARGAVRNLVRLETEARWAERFLNRRGRVNKDGSLKPLYELYVSRITPGGDQWRRLLDVLKEGHAGAQGPVRVVIVEEESADDGAASPPVEKMEIGESLLHAVPSVGPSGEDHCPHGEQEEDEP